MVPRGSVRYTRLTSRCGVSDLQGIDDHVSINVGEVKPGEITQIQTRKGFDFFYIMKGSAVLKYGSEEYEVLEGDAVYFDATTPHAWTSKTASTFVSINIRRP